MDGLFDYARGLDEYEQVAQNDPDILRFFQRGSDPFPTREQLALARHEGHQPSILHFSWKPAPQLTWRQIADGGADAAIASVADGLASYTDPFFLTIHHEPENDVIDTPGSGMTPADYVDMYRHVVGRLRDLGVDRAVLVMTYMGFEQWASIVDDLYPGDDVVDWIAYDPYGRTTHTSFADLVDQPDDPSWPGFYSWATSKAPGKPLMLAEWGYDPVVQTKAAAFLRTAPQILRDRYPAIKALVYWNDRGERVDARLVDRGDDSSADYLRAFAEMAADPYFNATSTSAIL